jgi:HAD superfamily hydrolase (TIGR01509 family)
MFTTIIFDLDGLLSDTETLHMKAYQAVLKNHGISLGEIDFQNHWIRDGLGIKDYVLINNLQFSADKLREEKAIIYQQLLDCELNEMPGAKTLLEKLFGKKRLALASSSYEKDVRKVLNNLQIINYFEVIATGSDVKNSKPKPDILLYAAKLMNVNEEECVVIDDAEKGIVAAHAAGMRSIAIPNRFTSNNDFQYATYIIDSLFEVEKTIELL